MILCSQLGPEHCFRSANQVCRNSVNKQSYADGEKQAEKCPCRDAGGTHQQN